MGDSCFEGVFGYVPAEHVRHHFHLGLDSSNFFGGTGLGSPGTEEEGHFWRMGAVVGLVRESKSSRSVRESVIRMREGVDAGRRTTEHVMELCCCHSGSSRSCHS